MSGTLHLCWIPQYFRFVSDDDSLPVEKFILHRFSISCWGVLPFEASPVADPFPKLMSGEIDISKVEPPD